MPVRRIQSKKQHASRKQKQQLPTNILLLMCVLSLVSIVRMQTNERTLSQSLYGEIWSSSETALTMPTTLVTMPTVVESTAQGLYDLGSGLLSALDGSAATTTTTKPKKKLPTLDELTALDAASYPCPPGSEPFANIVPPEQHNATASSKIPRVIHMTAKTRCVHPETATHIRRWALEGHALYFHDDQAVFRLLEYASDDAHGHELVRNLSRIVTCLTAGAALSDVWRLVVLWYYGGIYTDLDNAPGPKYTAATIPDEADSFFLVEELGTMSQFYLAATKFHPALLWMLWDCVRQLHTAQDHVMVNNPAKRTGPGAVKRGMIMFQKAVGVNSSGYLDAGIYGGGIGNATHDLPWLGNGNRTSSNADDAEDYPSLADLANRTVVVFGSQFSARKHTYIHRNGLGSRAKARAYEQGNMTHFSTMRRKYRWKNVVSCRQHSHRMRVLHQTKSSWYYGKPLADRIAAYVFNDTDQHYWDPHTNERMVPWKDESEWQ